MEILYFKKLNSTHKFLLKKIKEKKLFPPIAIMADEQTDGIGTRGKVWKSLKGNLFFSMCIDDEFLPNDLPKQSISIYFGYLLKEILSQKGSKIWLKWPNDFYLEDKKVGGVLSQKIGSYTIVSIGLNIKKAPEDFKIIDINLDKNELIKEFILKVKQVILWKYIFSKYRVEFCKSRAYKTTNDFGKKISLKEAVLENDGSIKINGKRMYSKNG